MGRRFVSRRSAIQLMAGAACTAALPASAARAQSGSGPVWGTPDPSIYPANFFPSGRSRYKVLEVHLYGGMSPWENFYHRPLPNGAGYRGFEKGPGEVVTELTWHSESGGIPNLCAMAPQPAETYAFWVDETHPVHFGPATKPLWAPPFADRTRVIAMWHDLLPHEAAIPYAATGFRLGRPQLAGLGAAIQRRAIALDNAKPDDEPRRTTPWSWILEPPGLLSFDNLDAFKVTGMHPGDSKPVTLPIAGGGILARLRRPNATPATDRLLAFYRDEYHRTFAFPGAQAARSKGFAEYSATLNTVLNADSLVELLKGAIQPVGSDAACVTVTPDQGYPVSNAPATGLRTAARLLADKANPAGYVCVIDGGLNGASGGGGYDTHGLEHSTCTATNLWNVLATLRALVDGGELDLDETLILLTTEFGRTPFRSSGGFPNPDSNGRDHWPQGYVNVMIGGPIRQRRVLGRLLDGNLSGGAEGDNGRADSDVSFNATDTRAAALLAAGIDPFAPDLYGVVDVSPSLRQGGLAPPEVCRNIVSRFFG